MSHALFPLLTLLPLVAGSSQDDPTREEMYARAYGMAAAVQGGTVEPNWFRHEEGFWTMRTIDGVRQVQRVIPEGTTPLFDVERLRASLESASGKTLKDAGVPFEELSLADDGFSAEFVWKGDAWRLDLFSYEITEQPRPSAAERRRSEPRTLRPGLVAGDPDVVEIASHDGTRFLGDDELDLTLRTNEEDEGRKLTSDGAPDHEWAVREAVWSPDDRRVAAYRADSRGVDRLPVVDWLEQVEQVEEHPYTKAGRPLAKVELHVVDVETGGSVQVEGTGLADHYVSDVQWSENGREVWFQRLDRRHKKLELLAANAETGAARVVLTEESETFVGGLHYWLDYQNLHTPVENEEQFLWISERDGWRHLYLYSNGGGLIARLTSGAWEVERVVAVDAERGKVYFLGHAEPDPYETHLYRVSLRGGEIARITAGAGEHAPTIGPALDTFVDVWSSPVSPPRTEYRRLDGELLQTVDEADVSGLADIGWRAPEPFVCKAADGETELHGLLYKPYDFDPGRRYPVVDYIYNGPFTKWVPRTFTDGRSMQAQAQAQLGFIVLIVDGRGTIGRGKAFQDVVYRSWGRNEIPDHAAVLRELASTRPWMDLERVGIFGGSWGGYMTLRALLTHPDVYHVGVATAAVADLIDHAALPIEGYMGLPADHPEEYEYASNLRLASELEGQLLLIHGTADVNATFSACMKMTAALIRAGKQHDLVVLPGADHWMAGGEGAAAYYDEARRDYFVEHLHPERVVPVDQ